MRAGYRQFTEFAQLLPEPVLLVAPEEGNILAANSAFCDALGYDRTTLAGRSFADLAAGGSADAVRQFIRRCTEQGETINTALTLEASGGEHLEYQAEGRLLKPRSARSPSSLVVRFYGGQADRAHPPDLQRESEKLPGKRRKPKEESKGNRPGPYATSSSPCSEETAGRKFRDSKEELVDAILRNVADGITVQDASGKLTYANEMAARSTGFSSPDEMLRAAPSEIFQRMEMEDEEGKPFPPERLPGRIAFHTGQPTSATIRFRNRQGGEERWALVHATPLPDHEGNVRLTINSFHDITELKRSEHALRQSLSRLGEMQEELRAHNEKLLLANAQTEAERLCYQELFEFAPDGYLVTDLESRILEANYTAIALLHAERSHLIGKPLLPLIGPASRGKLQEQIADLHRGAIGKIQDARILVAPKGHPSFPASVSISSTHDVGGRVTGMRWSMRDATEREKAEQGLALLAAIVESADEAIISKTLDGVITSWNQGAERVYGYTAEEAIGKPVTMLIPPGHDDEEPMILQRLRRGERVANYETVRRRKDGTIIDISLTVSPVLDRSGAIIGASKIVRNISERKRFEEAMARVEKRTAFLAQVSGIMMSSADYRKQLKTIADLSVPFLAGCCAIHVLTDDGALEQVALVPKPSLPPLPPGSERNGGGGGEEETPALLFPPGEPQAPAAGLFHVLRTGRSQMYAEVSGELFRAIADPELRSILEAPGSRSCLLVPLAARGRTLGTLTLIADNARKRIDRSDLEFIEEVATRAAIGIDNARLYHQTQLAVRQLREKTEQVQTLNEELERRVQERTEQLLAANKELESFSYSVSHDLRAPLRHIEGFVQLLLQGSGAALDERGRHRLQVIADSTLQMGALINDLLSFSRAGRVALSITKTDMNELVRNAITQLQPQVQGRSIEWKIGSLPPVEGDSAMLRLVWTNLIANAIKYTRIREQAIIEIGSSGQPAEPKGQILFFIKDNGAGFDMAYAEKLFGVFQRLHSPDEFEGTGIGLANVRRIVERHGGRAWGEGAIDRGATFYFSLPSSSFRPEETS